MQDTKTSPHEHADPAGTTSWTPARHAGAHAALADLPPPIPPLPLLPPPAFGAALILAIAGCFVTLFAWVCWPFCNAQLRAIERGERSTVGKDTILLARGMAKVITYLSLAVFVILVAVGFSRTP